MKTASIFVQFLKLPLRNGFSYSQRTGYARPTVPPGGRSLIPAQNQARCILLLLRLKHDAIQADIFIFNRLFHMFGVCLSSTNKKDRLCENPTQHAFWPMETNISSPKSIHYPTNAIQLFSIYSCVDNKPMLITQVYGYPHKGREGFWLTQGHGFRKSRGWQYGGEGSGLGRWTRLHPEHTHTHTHTHTQPHCMTHTTQHTLQHSLSAIRPVLRERLWNPRTANVCVLHKMDAMKVLLHQFCRAHWNTN